MGFVPWIDFRGIAAYENARREINDALARSSGVLVLLSTRAAYRPWVGAEFRAAAQRRVPIVGALIEPSRPPPWFRRRVIVRLYANWDRELERAVRALSRMNELSRRHGQGSK